jgi:hypothetical protein
MKRKKSSKAWSLEYDLALLEEVGNFNAHILEPKKKTKKFENVNMEDLLQDIMDNEAMKDESKKAKQNKGEQLVAGGKALWEKCALQILNGKAKPIGGDKVSFVESRASPTMSEISATGSGSGSKKKHHVIYSSMNMGSLRMRRKKQVWGGNESGAQWNEDCSWADKNANRSTNAHPQGYYGNSEATDWCPRAVYSVSDYSAKWWHEDEVLRAQAEVEK